MEQVNVCNKNNCSCYNNIKEKVVHMCKDDNSLFCIYKKEKVVHMCDDDNIIFYICKKPLTYDDIEENVIYMCDQKKLFYFFKYDDEIKIGINFDEYKDKNDHFDLYNISFYKAIEKLHSRQKTFNTDIIPKNIKDAIQTYKNIRQNKCGTFNKLTFFQKSVNHLKNNSLMITIIISACLIYYFKFDTFLNHLYKMIIHQ